jgi:hypothetical protein
VLLALLMLVLLLLAAASRRDENESTDFPRLVLFRVLWLQLLNPAGKTMMVNADFCAWHCLQ